MRRGGPTLQQHMEKVINLSKLVDKYAKDLDEKGNCQPRVTFIQHIL